MTNSPTAKPNATEDIRDAATLIIVRAREGREPELLMGRRHSNAIFLPNKFVFPGGRFDHEDHAYISSVTLPASDIALLQAQLGPRTLPEDVPALALTALRETFEETGLLIGKPARQAAKVSSQSWQPFCDMGIEPDTSGLRFFARAITPPGRTRRYDTRFFITTENHILRRCAPRDQELSEVAWLPLREAKSKDVASITRHILDDVTRYLLAAEPARKDFAVPFYFYRDQAFHRVLLSHQPGPA